MVQTKFRQELEIRQSDTDVESNVVEEIAGVNVLEDSLHPNDLRRYSGARVYIHNTHNVDLEAEIEHTNTEDGAFEQAIVAESFDFSSGGPTRTHSFSVPVGRVRFVVPAGSMASAPTGGFLLFEIIVTRVSRQ